MTIARVCDHVDPQSIGVLVDRLWPRGMAKADAPFAEWLKEAAPSAALRSWYGHRPDRFAEFSRRYRREMSAVQTQRALDRLRNMARGGHVVLLTAAKDLDRSGASVLREVLAGR